MSETRRSFHDELDDLQREILEMGELAGTAVQDAVHAITHGDASQAQSVIDMDDSIDRRYLDIEQRTLRTLALQTPVAADLRLISAIIHSSSTARLDEDAAALDIRLSRRELDYLEVGGAPPAE